MMGRTSVLLEEAEASMTVGEWDQAIEKLQTLKDENVKSSEVFSKLARAFALRGRYLTVLSIYLEWAECALERDEIDQAEEALGYALSLRPDSIEAHFMSVKIARHRDDKDVLAQRCLECAFLCLEKGEGDRSVALLKEAIEAKPEELELSLQLAELHVSLGQIGEAVKEYRRAINRLQDAGQAKKTLEPLRRLKILRPDDVGLLLELGLGCLQFGEIDEAEEQFRTVLKIDLENETALLNLATACQKKGRFRNGLLALNKVLQVNPKSALAQRRMGELHKASGNKAGAVQSFHKAAQLMMECGDRESAGNTYQEIVKIAPDDANALNGLHGLGLEPEPPEIDAEELESSEESATDLSQTDEKAANPGGTESTIEELQLAPSPPRQELLPAEKPPSREDAKPIPAMPAISREKFRRPALIRKEEYSKPESSKPTYRRKGLQPRFPGRLKEGLGPKTGATQKPMYNPDRAVAKAVEPEPEVLLSTETPFEPCEQLEASVADATPIELVEPPEPRATSLEPAVTLEPIPSFEEAFDPPAPTETPGILDEEPTSPQLESHDSAEPDPVHESAFEKLFEFDLDQDDEIFSRPKGSIFDDLPGLDEPYDQEIPQNKELSLDFLSEADTSPVSLEIETPIEVAELEPSTVLDQEEPEELSTLGLFPWDTSEDEEKPEEPSALDPNVLFPLEEGPDDVFKDFKGADDEIEWDFAEEDGWTLFPESCATEEAQEEEEEEEEEATAVLECGEPNGPPQPEDSVPFLEPALDFEIPPPTGASIFEELRALEVSRLELSSDATDESVSEISNILATTLPQTEDEVPEIVVESVESLEIDVPEEPILEVLPQSIAAEPEPIPQEPTDAGTTIDSYRTSLLHTPTDEEKTLIMGDMCLRYGLLKEALTQFQSLQKRNPGSVEIGQRVIKTALWLEDYETVKSGLWKVAQLQFDRGELQGSQDRLGDLLSLEPDHKAARQLMVEIFLASGQDKLAAWHLSQMVERWVAEEEFEHAATALVKLAEVAPSQAVQERLAQLYTQQGREPEAMEIYRLLRAQHESEELWSKAIAVAESIVESRCRTPEDREHLIRLYEQNGSTEEAVEQQHLLAGQYREAGELDKAIELLQDVLTSKPGWLEAERLLVQLYLQTDKVMLAEHHAESLAERFMKEKAYDKAIELFESWVTVAPTSARPRERLAQFYQLGGDIDGAKLEWLLVTETHETLGDFERAVRSLERALELAPEQLEWRLRLATIRARRLGQMEPALRELRLLFEAQPEWPDSTQLYLELLSEKGHMTELGESLLKLGDSELGRSLRDLTLDTIRQRMESQPDNLELRFEWGELCYGLGSLDLAIEQFQRLRRHKEYQLHSYRLLGLCFARKRGFNMLELALSQFRKGLALEGQDPNDIVRLRYDLANVLAHHGRATDAMEQYRACLELKAGYLDVEEKMAELLTGEA
jgi:tetratricopeptide (TPR) repeat protein